MKGLKRLVSFVICLTLVLPTSVLASSGLEPEDTIGYEEWHEEEADPPRMEEEWEQPEPEGAVSPDNRSQQDDGETAEGQNEDFSIEKPDLPGTSQQGGFRRETTAALSEETKAQEWEGDLAIYWNPEKQSGGVSKRISEQFRLGTLANSGDRESGSDHAGGLTPDTAVQSLNTAIRRAEKLSRQTGTEISDITIYAMSPMVIPAGTMYTVRGKGVNIVPWGRQSENQELLFILDGGQLSLNNVSLQPSDGGLLAEDATLIYIGSGKVQMGDNVESLGTFALDYARESHEANLSSASEVTASGSQVTASSSQADGYTMPLVELTNKFEAVSDYTLDLFLPEDMEEVTAVEALYSDSLSIEEFAENFVVVERTEQWSLFVEERVGGVLRDTTEIDEFGQASVSEAESQELQLLAGTIERQGDMELTRKSLVAKRSIWTRDDSQQYVYWNPGGAKIIGDTEVRAGNDLIYDGNSYLSPKKSWMAARDKAISERKPILCLSTIDLSDPQAGEYMKLGSDGTYLDSDGNFVLDGNPDELGDLDQLTLIVPQDQQLPVVRIPDNTSLLMRNIQLAGYQGSGGYSGSQMLEIDGGSLILDRNVSTDQSFIQMNLSFATQSEDHPIQVNHNDVAVQVYFGNINDAIEWRYADVVVAGPSLIAQVGGEVAAGTYLLEHIRMEAANAMTVEEGGRSQFKWMLRIAKDMDGTTHPSVLELYTDYYFNAIYWDGDDTRGRDTYYGATCGYPLLTFAKVREVYMEEMEKSLQARQEAVDENRDWTVYDVPDIIYICGTVSVTGTESWDLPVYNNVDVNQTPIIPEIRVHLHRDDDSVGGTQLHQTPTTLVHVTGNSASLTLSNYISIRNQANKAGYTVIADQGAALKLTGNAQLSGLADPADPATQTLGTQILAGQNAAGVISSASVELADDWTGSIHSMQYGLRAFGSATVITMNNGSIRNHMNKKRSGESNDYSAGVYLKDGIFHMNAGSIAENISNKGGSGVHLEGSAVFNMKKGAIERNSAMTYDSDGNAVSTTETAEGVGVNLQPGTTFNMGAADLDNTETVIRDNTVSNLFKGVGISIANGATLNMYSGMITGNRGSGTRLNNANPSLGGGIYNEGSLTITKGEVSNNGASFEFIRSNIRGAGLYLGGTSQNLSNLQVLNNECGTTQSMTAGVNGITGGGGMWITRSADLDMVTVEGNRGYFGGGIGVLFNNTTYKLKLDNIVIKNNIAATVSIAAEPGLDQGTGEGGGFYSFQAAIEADGLTIENNRANIGGGWWAGGSTTSYKHRVKNATITGNKAVQQGGGIYNNSYMYPFESMITENEAEEGGGIYNVRSLYPRDVKIIDNTAADGGGIYNRNVVNYSESENDQSEIAGNTARRGGGIFNDSANSTVTSTYTFILDFSKAIENTAIGAGAQGNNIYITQTNNGSSDLRLLQGVIRQPAGAQPGIYGIYMDTNANGSGMLTLDAEKVDFEGTDMIYLNTTNNYLRYLTNPPAAKASNLPVNLNDENFSTGSIVVRPANIASISYTYPYYNSQTQLQLDTTLTKTYPSNQDAASPDGAGVNYIRGGQLPARNQLGGYEAAGGLVNIILIGEGVYIDGINGDDENYGTGPRDAVKTFAKAKDWLIEYTNAAHADSSDTDGFSPFIYICGTVTVDGSNPADAVWDLDYTAPMFTTASKYRQAELDAGRTPEDAQMKRFTSFFSRPLVEITGAGTTLEIPSLIINGMADSVQVEQQRTSSPIFEITDATLVLQEQASLRNNYANMVVADHATVIINSTTADSETFKNRQVEIVRGDGVQLSNGSSLTMNGYGSILFPNAPTGMTQPIGYFNHGSAGRGVIVSSGSKLEMNDYSKIEFTDGEVAPLSSNCVAIIIGNATNSDQMNYLVMDGNAAVRNCYAGIALDHFDSDVTMQAHSELKDNYYGHYSSARGVTDISILMKDSSSVYNSQSPKVMNAGVSINGTTSSNSSDFDNENNKISFVMADSASIRDARNAGVSFQQLYTNVDVKMSGNAQITEVNNDATTAATRALYFANVRGAIAVDLSGASKISGGTSGRGDQYGVVINNNNNPNRPNPITVNMSDTSSITDTKSYGLWMELVTNDVVLNMNDSASIQGGTTAARIRNATNGSVTLNMNDNSFIAGASTYNLYMYTNASSGKHIVNMKDRSWIGGTATSTSQYGIYMTGTFSSGDQVDIYEVNLEVNALIGGDGAFDGNEARRGHSNSGIYTELPARIRMTGDSRLDNNYRYGIYSKNTESVVEYTASSLAIEMSERSKIANSWYSIFSSAKTLADGTPTMDETITMSGDASFENIAQGTRILNPYAKMYLKENARLENISSVSVSDHTLDMYGSLFMDGTVSVGGLTYLRTPDNPITLTKAVPDGSPEPSYQLHVAEGFVGQIVVKPDQDNVADASPFLKYFEKVLGDGMADARDLTVQTINIVLTGEDNVYIATSGKDTNNGRSPGAPVRTFAKAKELLETASFNFDEGAEPAILVCSGSAAAANSPLVVLAGDEEWSFDTGGYLTNDGNTWQPKIMRYEHYLGNLIHVQEGAAINGGTGAAYLNLKNITIDGGAERTTAHLNYAKELIKITKGTVTLGRDAVLQNHHINAGSIYPTNINSTVMGVLVHPDGTFIMDGGNIRELTMERLRLNRAEYQIDVGMAILNYGSVEIREGTIENNKVALVNTGMTLLDRSHHSAMVLNLDSSSYSMSGGSISNNQIDVGNYSNIYGGAVVFLNDAKGTIAANAIEGNRGGKGTALYYASTGKVIVSGGRFRNNAPFSGNAAQDEYAPVYINQEQFQIKGGGANFEDVIYLSSTRNIITISGNIYQGNRRYRLYLNQGAGAEQFKKGSVIVQPDGENVSTATSYLTNFEVIAPPYLVDSGISRVNPGGTIAGIMESQCLLLMQMVFLDSREPDQRPGYHPAETVALDGSSPQAAVKTFTEAKARGEVDNPDYFIIFVSGPVTPEVDETPWNLSELSYMCRYTGFSLYDNNKVLIPQEKRPAYHHYMILPAGDQAGELTLEAINIYGRRSSDSDQQANGESIIRVGAGDKVTINNQTLLARNHNNGNYEDPVTQALVQLDALGGAVRVDVDGILQVEGGTISNTSARWGSAIYQDAQLTDGAVGIGSLRLNNSPSITGDVYLNGSLNQAEAFITVTGQYVPGRSDRKIDVSLANENDGRPVVFYEGGHVATAEQISYFKLDEAITSVYEFGHRSGAEHILELRIRSVYYIDPINGNDSNSGSYPHEAVQTLAGLYQTLKDDQIVGGATVFVVNKIIIDDNIQLVNASTQVNGQTVYHGRYYQKDADDARINSIEIDGQIYFKRYSQPAAYTIPTFEGTLFEVEEGAKLELNGIYLDGHSIATNSVFDTLTAPAVVAEGALVVVKPGAELLARPTQLGGAATGATTATTLFSNNYNSLVKTHSIGDNDQSRPVLEGSSAGIEILSDEAADKVGSVVLEGVQFSNLMLGEEVTGGTDVYQNGHLGASERTIFTGTIFLEGLGSAANPDRSRYLTVDKYGVPFENNFNILMRDPYNTRIVVMYPGADGGGDQGPPATDLGYFLLEERVNQYYSLLMRPAPNKNILELRVPMAVYVDGVSGLDTNSGRTPSEPVLTMRKAYEELKLINGKVIYVVNTVEISDDMTFGGRGYEDGRDNVVSLATSTEHVDIRRFVTPKAAVDPLYPGYNVPTHQGVLFSITNGASLTLHDDIYLDGHFSRKNTEAYEFMPQFFVETETEVTNPVIEVKQGGRLALMEKSYIFDNSNTLVPGSGDTWLHGGAIYNGGTVELNGGTIEDNKAQKGAGIYQKGLFTIYSNAAGLQEQEIYLATENDGDDQDPIWGTDHVIHTAVLLDDNSKLDIQMDHAVAGRPVAQYVSHNGVDSQYPYYLLGNTVPTSLFLVENEDDDTLLELQDWRILKIRVPEEIFLAVYKGGTGDPVVKDGAVDGESLGNPYYQISNEGVFPARVTLTGFENTNTDAGITGFETMNLVETAANALSSGATRKDLYLAVRGRDSTNGFSGLTETSLHQFGTPLATSAVMGTLQPGETGNYEFIAAAGPSFINYYLDPNFPLSGSSITANQRKDHFRHLDQNTNAASANYARANYQMTYRVEIIPSRRN